MNPWVIEVMKQEHKKWVRQQFEDEFYRLDKQIGREKALEKMTDRAIRYREAELSRRAIYGVLAHITTLIDSKRYLVL